VIDALAARETFVVTRNGVAVTERRPIEPARPKFVASAELIALGAAGPRLDLAEFRADLDRIIDQSL
jgi:hypothetical protein